MEMAELAIRDMVRSPPQKKVKIEDIQKLVASYFNVSRIISKEKPMPELSHIDPRSAALLVMDYQVDTLTRFMTAAQSAEGRSRP
jgi:hypothetical protein